MSEVKWVKITTNMFDNRKIKHIRRLPEGNNIVLIWVMLLSLAGRCNASGMIFLTENIPYTNKMLADELGFDESVIYIALETLEKFGMISRNEEELLSINNWDEYQNAEGLDRIREQTRARVAKHRAAKKIECNVTSNVTVTQGNAIEEDIEEDIDKEDILLDSKESNCRTDVQRCLNAWNSLEKFGIKKVSRLTSTSQRYQMLSKRISEYGVESVLTAIENVKNSDFLQGKTNKRAEWFDFEWFVRPNNFPKVLEGKYDNPKESSRNDTEVRTSGKKWQEI